MGEICNTGGPGERGDPELAALVGRLSLMLPGLFWCFTEQWGFLRQLLAKQEPSFRAMEWNDTALLLHPLSTLLGLLVLHVHSNAMTQNSNVGQEKMVDGGPSLQNGLCILIRRVALQI